jgi:hypothetical protein
MPDRPDWLPAQAGVERVSEQGDFAAFGLAELRAGKGARGSGHSALSASRGSRRAAARAGKTPAIRPMVTAIPIASAT